MGYDSSLKKQRLASNSEMIFMEVSNSSESDTSHNGNDKQRQAIIEKSVSCVKVIDVASSLLCVLYFVFLKKYFFSYTYLTLTVVGRSARTLSKLFDFPSFGSPFNETIRMGSFFKFG